MTLDRYVLVERTIDDILSVSKDWSRHLIELEDETPEQLVDELNRKIYESKSTLKLVITDKGNGFYHHMQRPLRIPGTDMRWGWYRQIKVAITRGQFCFSEETLYHRERDPKPWD